MGNHAVLTLLAGKDKRIVAVQHGKIIDLDIEEALAMKKPLNEELYQAEQSISI